MIDKIEISKRDVKASQFMTWVFTISFLVIAGTVIFYSPTMNGLYTIVMLLIVTIYINYASINLWNVWYENDFLIIQNLYNTQRVSISQFEKIEMTSVFNNGYTLYLSNSEKYQFRIRPTQDLKLFFKTDPQFYAKKMTKILIEIKQKPSALRSVPLRRCE
jgi:hypothetical protein